jgi:hypothetical protein
VLGRLRLGHRSIRLHFVTDPERAGGTATCARRDPALNLTMNQLPRIAFLYYDTFESYRSFRAVNKKLLAAAFIAGISSAGIFWRAVSLATLHQGVMPRWYMMLSITAMLVCCSVMMFVRQARDTEAIRRVNGLIKNGPVYSLHQAKSALLSHLFAQPATSFLSIAESVRKCVDYSAIVKEPLSPRGEDILHFIHNGDARGRTLSLFLAGVTLVAGLTLFSAEIREEALQIVVLSRPAWLVLWLTGVIVLTGFYTMSRTLFALAHVACDLVSRRASTPFHINPALVRYLIKDLAVYQVWDSPTILTPTEQRIQSLLAVQYESERVRSDGPSGLIAVAEATNTAPAAGR